MDLSIADYIRIAFNHIGFSEIFYILLFSILFYFFFNKAFGNKKLAIGLSLFLLISILSVMSFAYTPYSWISWITGGLSVVIVIMAFVGLFRQITSSDLKTLSNEQERKQKAKEQEEIIRNTISCPNCNNTDLTFVDNNGKQFSVGKAIAGGLLTGGIGTLAGFAGKKGKTNKWHCKNCGTTFNK